MGSPPDAHTSGSYDPVLRWPGVMESCPLTPDRATRYERLAVDRAWRDMHHHARHAIEHIVSLTMSLQSATYGNDAQALAKTHEQAARLNALLEAIELRIAVDEGQGPS